MEPVPAWPYPRGWEKHLGSERRGVCSSLDWGLKSFILVSGVSQAIFMVWPPILQPLCVCWGGGAESCSLFLHVIVHLGRRLLAANLVSAWCCVCSPGWCAGLALLSYPPLHCTAFCARLGREGGSREVQIHGCFKSKPGICVSWQALSWAVSYIVAACRGDSVPFRHVGLSCSLLICAALLVC